MVKSLPPLLLGAAVALAAPLAHAATVYVDGESTSPTQDGSAAHPFHTIAAGVAAAAAGDTVEVGPGYYVESLTITKAITIEGAPRLHTVIEPMSAWELQAIGIELRSLAFDGLGTGTAIEATRPFVLEDSQIQDFSMGLWATGVAGNSTIRHNRFVDNRYSVLLTNSGWSNYVLVENNVLLGDGSGIGIYAYDSRFRGYHNAIVEQRFGVYDYLPATRNLPISYLRNNLIVANTYGVYGYNLDPSELKVWANAVQAPNQVLGVPAADQAWTVTDDCGVPLGTPWAHDTMPDGACIDAGVFAGDPDGSAADIGPYGGPQAGPVGSPWWQDFGCRGLGVFCPADAVAQWLAPRPDLRAAMVFYDDGAWVDYDGWGPAMRRRFVDRLNDAWYGIEDPMADPPPNLADPDPDDPGFGVHSFDDATDLYQSNVAHSLVTELRGRVPWSLDEYDPFEFELLLDGQERYSDSSVCFNGFCTPTGVGLRVLRYQFAAPGADAWAFARDEIGIGADRIETIGNAIDWARDNMAHHIGSLTTAEVYAYHWDHLGPIPTGTVMAGHDPVGYHPTNPWPIDFGFNHFTAGCHGTNYSLQDFLAPLNIPVEYVAPHHALPHFPADDRWMTHGDDPYNTMAKGDYPGEEMLIDDATYQTWFVNAPNAGLDNVGRRIRELAAEHLPLALQNLRCDDLDDGLSKADGAVFAYLDNAFSLAELDAMGFWVAIDTEIDSGGLCTVPLPLGSG